ncbi:MAG: globin domain-containing protein [Candidatus Limnocylindria bacterium]
MTPDPSHTPPIRSAESLYERVGGERWFTELVDRFYASVDKDPVLRPLYPEDLAGPKRRLTDFLVQRWGGPPKYTESRGHPRLRMRHFRFPIGQRERDAWLQDMTEALGASGLGGSDVDEMLQFFSGMATMVINR